MGPEMGPESTREGARKWGRLGLHEGAVQWGPNTTSEGPPIGPHLDGVTVTACIRHSVTENKRPLTSYGDR
jgi:hypothetical protein